MNRDDSLAQGDIPRIITQALLDHVWAIAQSCRADWVFVSLEAVKDYQANLPEGLKKRLIYVTHSQAQKEASQADNVLKVPDVQLNRFGQVKIAMLLAIGRGMVQRGDIIIFLSSMASPGRLDTLVVAQVSKEHEALSPQTGPDQSGIAPEVIERSIDLATQLGSEGREGNPLGALFVIGDTANVLPLTRQLILNPFQGYPEQRRNILDEQLEETVKELATIDGAFIIRDDGVIVSAGAYLKTITSQDIELPAGLGARHYASAAITGATGAVAIAVSKSTGKVSIFRAGKMVAEIERTTSREFSAEPMSISEPVSGGPVATAGFEDLVEKAAVLDIVQPVNLERFFGIAAEQLAKRLTVGAGEIYRKLIDREKETSTALSQSLAIPHIIIEGTGQMELLMARDKAGIAFSPQVPAVKIVFVLAATRDQRNLHLRALASIAQMIQNPGFEQRWLNAADTAGLKELVLLSHLRRT